MKNVKFPELEIDVAANGSGAPVLPALIVAVAVILS